MLYAWDVSYPFGCCQEKLYPFGIMTKIFSPSPVGNRLKLLRGGLSQKQFSAKLGISLTSYQRYEHGERLPPFDVLSKISTICDVSLDWIIKGREGKGKGELSLAIDNLNYIIMRGPFNLMDFIIEVLDLAISCCRLDIDVDKKSPEEVQKEFEAFLNELLKIVPKTLFKSYNNTAKQRMLLDQFESDSGDNSTKN